MVDMVTGYQVPSLVSLLLQSTLYGIYLVSCGDCAIALTRVNGRWRSRKEIQWPFLLTGIFLLINTTFCICLGFYRCLELFVYHPDGPTIQRDSTYWINIVKSVQILCQSTVGDFILIYRTFVVYRKNWRIIVPSLILWLADTACACKGLQVQAVGGTMDQYNRWFIAFWALSLAHHVMTTLLLLRRLWRINRSLPEIVPCAFKQETSLHFMMRSIAESGMLYTVTALIVLICQLSKSYRALRVASAVEMVAVGIAFNLILTRAKRWNDTQQAQQSSDPQFTTIGPVVYPSTFNLSVTTIEGKT